MYLELAAEVAEDMTEEDRLSAKELSKACTVLFKGFQVSVVALALLSQLCIINEEEP